MMSPAPDARSPNSGDDGGNEANPVSPVKSSGVDNGKPFDSSTPAASGNGISSRAGQGRGDQPRRRAAKNALLAMKLREDTMKNHECITYHLGGEGCAEGVHFSPLNRGGSDVAGRDVYIRALRRKHSQRIQEAVGNIPSPPTGDPASQVENPAAPSKVDGPGSDSGSLNNMVTDLFH